MPPPPPAPTASSSSAQPRRPHPHRAHHHHDDDEDRIGPYTIADEIGRGSFATVYRGERLDSRAPVAIKSVIRSKLTTKLLENLESEISILKRIRHRNIVELKDCLKTDTHIYLVMDFCSAGDLSLYIRKRGDLPSLTASNQGLLPDSRHASLAAEKVLYPHPKEGGLNETIVRCFLGQLVDALRFLRSQNVIHRDIKPQNLLLQPAAAADLAAGHAPGIPVLKVADFGFARWLPSQSMAETLCGSPLYMAPEILRYEKYDAKADLWSVGAVLFEMSVGKPPFRAQNHVDLLRKIERGEDRIKFPDEKRIDDTIPLAEQKVPTKVAADIKALIRRLLKRHPAERMSFDDFFRDAAAVAQSGTASGLVPAEIVSARVAAGSKTPTAARRSSPAVPSDSVAADRSTRRDLASPRLPPPVSTNVARASPVPSRPSPSTAPSPSPTSAAPPPVARRPTPPCAAIPPPSSAAPAPTPSLSRFAPAADADPPPFARRTSTAPSPPPLAPQQAPPMRRGASIEGGPRPQVQRAQVERVGSASGSGASASASGEGSAVAVSVGRRSSDSPMPSSSPAPPSAIERFASANKGGTDSMSDSNDSVLGKDYVVVEKRTVEINALADELAQQQPQREGVVVRRPSRGFLSRPMSSLGNPSPPTAKPPSPPSSSSPSSPYPPGPGAQGDTSTPPFAIPQRAQPTPHHPYSLSSSPRPLSFLSSSPRSFSHTIERFPGSPLALVGSPSAALAKAFNNLSSLKIFGSPTDGILVRRSSVRKPIPRSMTAPVAVDPEEERVLADLEDIAQKALVLFEFADSKILQLLPPTPAASTSTTSLGTPSYFSHLAAREQAQAQSGAAAASNPFSPVPTSPSMRRGSSSSSDRPLVMAGSAASGARADVLAAEALVLYLKALAFLGKGIERARKHWANRPAEQQAASADFNDAVQWFRQRFNECFDKADFAKTRCQDEIPESAAFAEKLVWDRALELSRAAAVNELRGENPTDCETAYETALWMLYALLDVTMHSGTPDASPEADEDRATVSRFVQSITARLQALRKKLAPVSNTASGATTAVVGSPNTAVGTATGAGAGAASPPSTSSSSRP
ncbi:serine/threonine protein kinase ATG1 [Rhodotorula paludigena]|uniref:serine/threonine protein kinase ATG1 n=1 Tax=Rhodotorula paludigena TaxID=86838 RepID=UPI00317350F8